MSLDEKEGAYTHHDEKTEDEPPPHGRRPPTDRFRKMKVA